MRIAAVVVTRSAPRGIQALSALAALPRPPELSIVVDNGGANQAALRAALPLARVVVTPRNLGFAGGANAGIEAALREADDAVEALLLVNDDAHLAPEALGLLEQALARPGVGIVGPALLDAADPGRVESIGLSFRRATGRLRELRRRAAWSAAPPVPVQAVSGCVMLLRRELLEAVGCFDPGFFFSAEDVDLCLRARAAGWEVLAVPAARAWHARGATLGRRAPARLYHAVRGQLRLGGKLGGPGAPLRQAATLGWALVHALRRGREYEPGAARAVLRAGVAHALGRPWRGAPDPGE